MQVHEQKHGAVTVLKPVGPLTQDDANLLKTRMDEVGKASMGRFVLDVSSVPFIDSRGLEVLVEVHDEQGASGQSLKLSGIHPNLREVLDVTELAPLFEQYEDATAAVRSFL